jgi:catechol 2,3-dioxygenase-like lactoylglutathione lyase family enzyme
MTKPTRIAMARMLTAALACAFAAATVAVSARQPQQSTAADRPPITGIARVAFRVTSLDPAREFYGRVLGLSASGSGGCVRFRVNDRQEIAISPGLPADEEERLAYLAFETPSVETFTTYLNAHGVTPESNPPKLECVASRAVWVKDPDGHLLAFVEPQRTRAAASQSTQPRAVSARVLHAGLTIRDPQAADKFYKDVLGFSEIWRGGRTDDVTSWINMKVPNGTDYLEYMLVSAPVSRQQRGVLHHVAMLVPDIQAALETVTDRTAPAARAKLASPQVGRNKRWQLNLYDADGTRVELMEPFTMR